ncbi:unnamed protein product [Owenia fusiformis]|nr:unnamed protein product [Owenia fusiformis]
MSTPKLSLVAAFDDLTRNTKVLTKGIEHEFYTFVLNQEECRKKWLAAEEENHKLKLKLKELEGGYQAYETKLRHARSQIDHELKRRNRAEQDRDALERQIALIQELLGNNGNNSKLDEKDRERLHFLSSFSTTQHHNSHHSPRRAGLDTICETSASILSPSDISEIYDKTDDGNLEISFLRSGKRWKRPSAPPFPDEEMEMEASPPNTKRRKSGADKENSAITTTTTVKVPQDGGPIEATHEVSANPTEKKSRKNRKRSKSAGEIKLLQQHRGSADSTDSFWGIKNNINNNHAVDDQVLRNRNLNSPESQRSPLIRHYSSAGKLNNRAHIFVSKTVIRPETCNPCGKRIKFGKPAMKCRDCKATCHPDCRDQVALPCVPSSATPGTAGKLTGGVISDYTPTDPPMIPGLVVHCVNEVESRGIQEVGIYRVPGAERQVKDLKEKFLRGKGMPNLTAIDDIHVVCGCLKDFLRSLKEPLVTYSLWRDFVSAAERNDQDECLSGLYQAISELPPPNRDTLAFMILHLQKIAESAEAKMPAANLAKVFGPTMIGYSTPEPEPMQMINETKKQATVMEGLLSISSDYWSNFINVEEEPMYIGDGRDTPQTPEPRQGPSYRSMLGPVGSAKTGKTTPRFGSKSKQSNKKPSYFFASPHLK